MNIKTYRVTRRTKTHVWVLNSAYCQCSYTRQRGLSHRLTREDFRKNYLPCTNGPAPGEQMYYRRAASGSGPNEVRGARADALILDDWCNMPLIECRGMPDDTVAFLGRRLDGTVDPKYCGVIKNVKS